MEPGSLPAFIVHKFGGTSVATAERMRAAASLVISESAGEPDLRPVVVTSAMGGVTDRLLAAISAAEERTGEHPAIVDELRERHLEAARLLDGDSSELEETLTAIIGETEELLQGIYLLRQCTRRFSDAVISAGERLAAPLFAAALRREGAEAVSLDARVLVRTDDAFGEASVDQSVTREQVRRVFRDLPRGVVPVVTGFIASTADGVTTTLGRSGSDFSATIMAAALDARRAIIWTDVAGVKSADPRIVPEAFTLPELSYREAAELAHFGARVLHPRTMRPIERAGIPLEIRNTLAPDQPGTLITSSERTDGAPIRAVTAVRDVALITLDGAGLIGVPTLTARVFGALSGHQIPVLLIAQASSEGSICFAVREADGSHAESLLRHEFMRECERGDLQGISSETGLAVIAAVGEGLREAPGLAGRMFATLGRAHVNVRAIAEGASDHNLSCVVRDDQAPRAVQALHEAFALRRLRAHLAVIGAGAIGRSVLELLGTRAGPLIENQRINLRLVCVADSRRIVWDESGIDYQDAPGNLEELTDETDEVLDVLTRRLQEAALERLIVVDATPSADVARRYPEWLRLGAAVVTPNQLGLTMDYDLHAGARAAAREAEVPFLYETTVGAGLSILSTLRDLVRTGDRVNRIEGVFSGTLSFVFSAMRAGQTFSAAVREAATRGYAEPDPRSDLRGDDVARKLVILAREMGLQISLEDVRTQSLVAPELEDVSEDEFWERLPTMDAFWQQRLQAFHARGQQLHYVAVLSGEEIRAGVRAVSATSAFGQLDGAAVLFEFHTDRYHPSPLIVRGPGASRQVTTAVLFADIVRAAEAMR